MCETYPTGLRCSLRHSCASWDEFLWDNHGVYLRFVGILGIRKAVLFWATFFRLLAKEDSRGDFEISFARADDGRKFNRNMDIDGRLIIWSKQWMLANRIYIDWRILGGSYGPCNGCPGCKSQLRE